MKKNSTIQVNNVSFSYTNRPFLEEITFEVEHGEIFGFLGPSGAGKSTLQKILTGIIRKYNGEAIVDGHSTKKITDSFYETIGVDFEFPSLYEKMTALQNLMFFASLYKNKTRNPEKLLEQVGLLGDKDKKVSDFSKGMKSRLNFIKSLLHDPELLFLDEPTSGLDPTNSRIMKDLILEEKKRGKTVILTTHNMEDATELCDRVAFIVDGKVKALDSPHNLIMRKGAVKVKYTYMDGIERQGECLIHEMSKDHRLAALMNANKITSIHSSEPTLNDIFIDITGRKLA
ncbi:MAG: ABC transporter ATP-binding protein [bacterium]|nr:ABC transporter ATP-binding protein [bacterium]